MINKPVPTVLLLIPLVLFVAIKGILPALTGIQTDFPNYYTAGIIARTGVGVEQLYDDEWFQEQIHAHGIEQQGKFSPFPPTTAVLFVPFSFCEPLTALRVMTALNAVLLLSSIVLMAKLFSFSLLESIAFGLLTGLGITNCFRFGQLYIALSFSMLCGFSLINKRKEVLAGFSFGSLIAVKYFPIILVSYFVVRRKWRIVASALFIIFAMVALSVAVLGWNIHAEFVRTVIGQHLQSSLSHQNPFSPTFQSFDSLFRRLFVADADMNPSPFYASSTLFVVSKSLSLFVCIASALVGLKRLSGKPKEMELSLAILCLLGLVIAPATATYHYLLLWLPIGILLHYFHLQEEKRLFWTTLLLYGAIGFTPYSFFRQFDGNGLLTFVAYPRLAMMIALFGISILTAIRETRPRFNSERKTTFQR